MRAGIVILTDQPWAQAVRAWQAAERYGLHHAWTYDHLGWRTLVDGPWYGAVPVLTAAATATSTIKLGTFVASPHFRHPVPFARELLALDDISGGRFLLGVGAGTLAGYDRLVLGGQELPRAVQAERFEEFVELLDAVLTRERTTWRGRHFTAVDARSAPGCVQQPRIPFVVASVGARTMRLAARFGQGWATTGTGRDDTESWWRSLRELSARMDDTLAAADRDLAAIDRYLQADAGPVFSLSSVESYRDILGRAQELGFTDVVSHWPRPGGVYAGSEAVLEQVAAEVLPELAGA
jgi:alkanesulfonate monooxygenase SsuD/methylene tetrahydromethanopterin reductase-like flavin-dependent oxidoreductase (luciferase family)